MTVLGGRLVAYVLGLSHLLNIAFDMAAWEILGCLSHGSTLLIRDRDIIREQGHTERSAGQPRKRGVNVGGRRRQQKERKNVETTGYVVGGGGGHKGGGGNRAVLDEKKMVAGKPRRKRLYRAK